jgi:hypothetical protein
MVKTCGGGTFACSAVPIRSIRGIAFLSMKIGVDQHAGRVIPLLCEFVRSFPIAFGIPP